MKKIAMSTTATTAIQPEPQWLLKRQVAELLQGSLRQVEILVAKDRIAKPVYLGTSSPRWNRAALLASLTAE